MLVNVKTSNVLSMVRLGHRSQIIVWLNRWHG